VNLSVEMNQVGRHVINSVANFLDRSPQAWGGFVSRVVCCAVLRWRVVNFTNYKCWTSCTALIFQPSSLWQIHQRIIFSWRTKHWQQLCHLQQNFRWGHQCWWRSALWRTSFYIQTWRESLALARAWCDMRGEGCGSQDRGLSSWPEMTITSKPLSFRKQSSLKNLMRLEIKKTFHLNISRLCL